MIRLIFLFSFTVYFMFTKLFPFCEIFIVMPLYNVCNHRPGDGKIAPGRKQLQLVSPPSLLPAQGDVSGKTKLTQQVHSAAAGAFAARENLLSEKRCDIRDFSFRAKLYFAVPVIDRQLSCGN